MKISVIGAGVFGTVIGNLLAKNGHEVLVHTRLKEVAAAINQKHVNIRWSKDFKLHKYFKASSSFQKVMEFGDIIILAQRSDFFRDTFQRIKPYLQKDHILVNVTKGLEQDSFLNPSLIVKQESPFIYANYLSMMGPNIANDIYFEKPTITTIAGSEKLYKKIAPLFQNEYFFIEYFPNRREIELAGSIKNIYAIGAGLLYEQGENAFAWLVYKASLEMENIFKIMNLNHKALLTSAGIGDLIVTCRSQNSRNFTFGKFIVQGSTPTKALKQILTVVEGYENCKNFFYLLKKDINKLPILHAIYTILYQKKKISQLIHAIRDRRCSFLSKAIASAY